MRKHRRAVVGDLCDLINGNGFRPSEWKASGLPIIRIQNLNGSQGFNYFDGRPRHKWIVEPGNLLFAWAGVKGVSFGPTIWKGPRGVLNQHIYRVQPKKHIDLYWLYCVLQRVTSLIEQKAHGFKSSLLHVHKEDIAEQMIDVPPLAEQRRIAKVLRTWDEAIDRAARLVGAQRSLYEGLVERLAWDRVSDEGTKWRKLASALEASRERVSGRQQVPIFSVTKAGLIPQEVRFRKRIASENLSRHMLVRPSEFVISGLNFWLGSVDVNVSERALCVSPDYKVFRLLDCLDPAFFRYVVRTARFKEILRASAVERASIVRRNFDRETFLSSEIPVPSVARQRTIAAVLQHAERQLELSEMQRQGLDRQKRGLMQKLLTGEWHVPARDSRVEQVAEAAGEAVAGAG